MLQDESLLCGGHFLDDPHACVLELYTLGRGTPPPPLKMVHGLLVC